MTTVTAIAPTGQTQNVVAAVKNAAATTGADFDYLLQTAVRESSLEPSAKAATSSAAGLFQFIEQTWLGVVKRYGAEFGLDAEAAAIDTSASGRHKVSDRGTKEAILALRHDPEVSALMAGALTKDSAQALESGIGRQATAGELYAAHFLGVGGAVKLIATRQSDPNAGAAALFPLAAKANTSIFYDRVGGEKTVSEVYDRLTQETDIGAQAQAAIAAIQAQRPVPRPAAVGRPAGLQLAAAVPSVLSGSILPGPALPAGARTPGAERAPLSIRTQSPLHAGPGPITLTLPGAAPSPKSAPAASPFLVLTPAVMDVLAALDPLPAVTANTADKNTADKPDTDTTTADKHDAYRIPGLAFGNAFTLGMRGTLA